MEGVTSQDRALRFNNKSDLNELFKQLSKQRELEIESATAAGLIHDPTARRTLDTAVNIVGTCQDFCSYFEKVERHLRNEVKRPEMRPGSDSEPDYSRMVKAFVRPTDNTSIKVPSEIRPPPILEKTVDYLFHDLLPQAPSWISVQEFIFDRTRAIRQDFTIQGNRSPIAVECHERIARFHILSLHESKFGSRPDEDWEREFRAAYSLQLDIAQLNKTLTTLMQFYDDFRAEGVTFPNEAEFRAYRLLLQFRDGDVARRTQRIPFDILSSPWIQAALDLRNLAQHPSSVKSSHPGARCTSYVFARILKELKQPSTTFLMASLMETNFMQLRKEALRAMAGAYLSKTMSVEKCRRLLGFETDDETLEFVKDCGLAVDESGSGPSARSWKASSIIVNKMVANSFSDATPKASKNQSALLTAKRGVYSWEDIIDGRTPPPGSKVANPTSLFLPAQVVNSPVNSFAVPTLPPSFGGSSPAFGQKPTSTLTTPTFNPFAPPKHPAPAFGNTSSSSATPFAFGAINKNPFGASAASFGVPLATKPPVSVFASPTPPPPQKPVSPFNLGSSISTSASSPAPSLPFTLGAPKLSASAKEFVPGFGLGLGLPSSKPVEQPIPSPAVKEVSSAPVPERVEPPPRPTPPPRRPSIRTSPILVRKPSISSSPTLIRKPSISVGTPSRKSSLPESPAAPSPRTLSQLDDERNNTVANNLLRLLVKVTAEFEVASAFAEEWAERHQRRSIIRFWKARAIEARRVRKEEEALELERKERWGRLMKRLDGTPPGSPSKWKGKEKEVPDRATVIKPSPASVEEMQRIVSDTTHAREIMWERGVFLGAVMARTAESSVKGMKVPPGWSIWLFGERGATWRWIRVKFGVEDEDEGEEKEDFVVLPLEQGEPSDGRYYPGLIVLELSPTLATLDGSDSDAAWTDELERLTDIVHRIPKGQPYRPALLAIYWGNLDADPTYQAAEAARQLRDHLDEHFPSVYLQIEVVVFGSPEAYHEDFERGVERIVLDTSGRLVTRHRFDYVVSNFVSVWEDAVGDMLTVCSGHKAESPAVKWPALGRTFGLALEGLNTLEQSVCDILDVVVEDPLPDFRVDGIVDAESLGLIIQEYLAAESLTGDVMLITLRTELHRASMKGQDIPLRRVLDQLAWHVAGRLEAIGSEVVGDAWKAASEQYRIDLRLKTESLSSFVDGQYRKHHHHHKAAEPSVNGNTTSIKKKRVRVSSGESATPDVIKKKARSSPEAPRFAPTPESSGPPFAINSELADLERLIAESEAMLAAR